MVNPLSDKAILKLIGLENYHDLAIERIVAQEAHDNCLRQVVEELPKQVKPLLDKIVDKYPMANSATVAIYLVDEIVEALKQQAGVGK